MHTYSWLQRPEVTIDAGSLTLFIQGNTYMDATEHETGSSTRSTQRTAQEMLLGGFAEMPVDPAYLSEWLPIVRDGMRTLTDDPEKGALFPMQVPFVDSAGWQMEAGLVRRTGTDESGNREDKFFFHFIPGVRWQRQEEINEFLPFLSACEALNKTAKNIVLTLANEIDDMHGISRTDESLFHAITQAPAVTRVLRYLDTDKSQADAYTHIDRSAITVHWWASHPGLVIIDNLGNQYRVDEAALDKVTVFPSKKFAAFFQGRYGLGTPHGVHDTRRKRKSGEDRYSLVSFVHAKLSPQQALWLRENTAKMDELEKQYAL